MTLPLKNQDLKLLQKSGISKDNAEKLFDLLNSKAVPVAVDRPAIIGDGIVELNDKEKEYYYNFSFNIEENDIIKFIPASGAASRMFDFLISFYNNKINNEVEKKIDKFVKNFNKLPYYYFIKSEITDRRDFNNFLTDFLKYINFGNIPKAFVYFHTYSNNDIRTSLEEHFYESSQQFKEEINIHFTFSREFMDFAREFIIKFLSNKRFNQKVQWSYSEQKSSTRTFALDSKDNILKDKEGNIVLRPGGHGALLENLNNIEKKFILIKNIDNIPVERLWHKRNFYQRILLGIAAEILKIFKEISREFITNKNSKNIKEKIDYLNSKYFLQLDYNGDFLKKPLRVVGVVKNTGEPGGGPFWVKKNGLSYLAILEKQQIDGEYKELLLKSTHFNPVDMVVCPYSVYGEKFDLSKFIDNGQFLIANKTYLGETIKIIEYPGLWNGSMFYYNTVFVDIPLETFAPVKNILDLLRPEHQV